MNILVYLFILGICLSVDAFSISLNLGWQIKEKYKWFFFTLSVGMLHFLMPILGAFLGSRISKILDINTDFFMGLILFFIGLTSLLSINKDEELLSMSVPSLLGIALSVSVDSFTLGIGLIYKRINILLSGLIFSFCSSFFTYFGLLLGKYLSTRFDQKFKMASIILLLLLGVIHILR